MADLKGPHCFDERGWPAKLRFNESLWWKLLLSLLIVSCTSVFKITRSREGGGGRIFFDTIWTGLPILHCMIHLNTNIYQSLSDSKRNSIQVLWNFKDVRKWLTFFKCQYLWVVRVGKTTVDRGRLTTLSMTDLDLWLYWRSMLWVLYYGSFI